MKRVLTRDTVAIDLPGSTKREIIEALLDILKRDPFETPPSFVKLVGNLKGFYSRRINIQHRLVYSVDEEKRIVHVLRMWTHYK